MKGLKKLNLGLVLAIIVVIGVVIYCIKVGNERKSAKSDINKACEDFIMLTDKYAVLPEDKQVIGIKKTDVNLTDISSKAKVDFKEKMLTEDSAEIESVILQDVLEKQLIDTSKIATSFERKISKITSYQFDGNQVTVTFDSKVSQKKKYRNEGDEAEKVSENSFEVQGETITLEKKDGNWKVVYASLKYVDPNSVITF